MNSGIGPDKTVREHREWVNQLYTSYAHGREAQLMAAVVGDAGLSDSDRHALQFAQRFEERFVNQGTTRRTIGDTIAIGWSLLDEVPRRELSRLSDAAWQSRAERGTPSGATP
jgi:V/A-type H+-transporting ATPase subunit B